MSAGQARQDGRMRLARALNVAEPVALVALPVFMAVYGLLGFPNVALVTAIAAIVALVPFFARFELSKLRARDLMPIVVMSALGVAGRMIFAPVPAIKPVMALVVLTGLSFGRQAGFLTGALTLLVSNIFFGQGPWTPWQMYGFGLAGYIAGCLRPFPVFRRTVPVAVLGFVLVFLYGGILDTWTLLGFVGEVTPASALATYGAGLSYNFLHAVGTVVFLLPVARPFFKIFDRIKLKYRIGVDDADARGAQAALARGASR